MSAITNTTLTNFEIKPRPYSKLEFLNRIIDPVKPFPFNLSPFPQTITKTTGFKLDAVYIVFMSM